MATQETVEISREEYDELIDKANMLEALYKVGVVDWSGFLEALIIYEGD